MDNSPVFFPQLASKGIFRIKDLYNETDETNWETVHAMGVEPQHYLYWASITTKCNSTQMENINEGRLFQYLGEQGWRSGESARLPPMWPGFDFRSRRHMWVEFVVGSRPCSERFFSGYSGFPLSSKTNISKFQFDLESVPN